MRWRQPHPPAAAEPVARGERGVAVRAPHEVLELAVGVVEQRLGQALDAAVHLHRLVDAVAREPPRARRRKSRSWWSG